MVKVEKILTKNDLMRRNYELKQEVAKLEIQIGVLKDVLADKKPYVCPAPYQPPVFREPWVYPFMPVIDDGGTGDPLPATPYIVCGVA